MMYNTTYIDISITISTIQLYTGSLSGYTVHHLAGVQYTIIEFNESNLCLYCHSSQYRVPVNRPTLIRMLLEGLSFLEDLDQYLLWAEQCLDEAATVYLSSLNDKSEGIVVDHLELWLKLLGDMLRQMNNSLYYKRATLNVLSRRHLARLAENLVLICSRQLESCDSSGKILLDSTLPWILLHRTIEFEEKRLSAVRESKLSEECNDSKESDQADVLDVSAKESEDEGLPCSVLFLLSAHDLLGKRSWCMLQEGMFAIYIFEVISVPSSLTIQHSIFLFFFYFYFYFYLFFYFFNFFQFFYFFFNFFNLIKFFFIFFLFFN